ncbi:MAG: hypothetical protein E7232_06650 [Lachnospiraceae bacterium]|nr:hypothetical protein [Lachnospiraceae bacterium]
MTRHFVTMPDKLLDQAMNVVYNKWFKKWTRKTGHLTEDDWAKIIGEYDYIVSQNTQNGDFKVLETIAYALLKELMQRDKGEDYPPEEVYGEQKERENSA